MMPPRGHERASAMRELRATRALRLASKQSAAVASFLEGIKKAVANAANDGLKTNIINQACSRYLDEDTAHLIRQLNAKSRHEIEREDLLRWSRP